MHKVQRIFQILSPKAQVAVMHKKLIVRPDLLKEEACLLGQQELPPGVG